MENTKHSKDTNTSPSTQKNSRIYAALGRCLGSRSRFASSRRYC